MRLACYKGNASYTRKQRQRCDVGDDMTTVTVSGFKIRKGEKTIRYVCTVRTVEGYNSPITAIQDHNNIIRIDKTKCSRYTLKSPRRHFPNKLPRNAKKTWQQLSGGLQDQPHQPHQPNQPQPHHIQVHRYSGIFEDFSVVIE